MENIRCVKERIRFCISCGESQCTFIKERLDNNVTSHYSFRRSFSSQQITPSQQWSKTAFTSRTDVSDSKLDEHTSTSNLIAIEEADAATEPLQAVILECIKNITNSQEDGNDVNVQNIINKFTERVSQPLDYTDENGEPQLDVAIDEFTASLPLNIDKQNNVIMNNLKSKIATIINEFNKRITNCSNKQNRVSNIDHITDKYTSTECNKQTTAEVQNSEVNILTSSLYETNNTVIQFSKSNGYLNNKIVKAQISNSLTSKTLVCSSTQIQTTPDNYNKEDDEETKHINSHSKVNNLKKYLTEWLLQLNNEVSLNISYSKMQFVLEDLGSRLFPIPVEKNNILEVKIILQEELLSFLTEYFNIPKTKINIDQLNECAENLAIILLTEKSDSEISCLKQQNPHFVSHCYNNTRMNEEFDIIKSLLNDCVSADFTCEYNFGNTTSVYKSETELLDRSWNPSYHNNKSSFTKKKKKTNAEMQIYIQKLGNLINTWINTLPSQKHSKSKKIKDTISNNLVEDILDQVKLEQIAPETSLEKDKYLSFFIYRWLNRYEYIDNISLAKPHVDDLIEKIKVIAIPNYLTSQKPSQKELLAISLKENAPVHQKPPLCQDKNKFSNELGQWIDEQPFQIFFKSNKSLTRDLNKKFASKLQNQINNLSSEQITKEIKNWLNEVIKPDHKEKIPALAEALKSRINTLIPDKNINCINEQNLSKRIADKSICCDDNVTYASPENKAKEIIATFLEHKYDSDNFIAREACVLLVKRELQRLGDRFRLDTNLSTNTQDLETSIDKLSKELQYIRIISDSLKRLPLQEDFNVAEYSDRAEQINILAKTISDFDENNQSLPPETNYDNLTVIISDSLKKLNIPSYFEPDTQLLVDDLAKKILVIQQHSPCCQFKCLTSSDIADLTLSDYVEAYIRENGEELFDDDLKLQACVSRLFNEINQVIHNSADYSTSYIRKNISKRLPCQETVAHFVFEMKCANEISDWLSNLPLLQLTDEYVQDQLAFMINNLVEKISEYNNLNNKNLNKDVDKELINYVSNWLTQLPLDTNKEIPFIVLTQQLINRMKRIDNENKQQNNETQNETSNLKTIQSFNSNCNSCRNKTNISLKNSDPGTAIVETIEEWCNNLPIKTGNETTTKMLKQNVATKLYQKLGELNMNPKFFNNHILYEEMLSEEIDNQLQSLPENKQLNSSKKELKKDLLKPIIALRNEIKNRTSGVEYKHDLQKTIEMSMPSPVRSTTHHEDSPGFKIYKDRLATMFILENFDHGNDAVKLNYEKRIRNEIDKYFRDVQMKNSIPLTKDQIYNDLYSALFNVPLPNEASMIDEVEEIKTRCEIDSWFENLPLREPAGVGELLTWDQILAMLAKRLHEFEKYNEDSDDKIHREITKWLVKLPLLPQQANNVDFFANELQQRLKSTASDRRHIPRGFNKSQKPIIDVLNSYEIDTSSSNLCLTLPSLQSTCCRETSTQKPKKIADIILGIVQAWCSQLPLPANTPEEQDNIKVLKDNLMVKIILKINEMNINPETFNNDFLYDSLLDVELETVMSELPASSELDQSRTSRKKQLKEAIISIKPLIMEEKAKHEYKMEIKSTIDKLLPNPREEKPEIKILCNCIKEEIANHFIIYNLFKHDDESGWKHKTLLHDFVEKYFTIIDTCSDKSRRTRHDPLLKGNQLICELAKITAPGGNALLDEVQEILIKYELTKLFNDLSLTIDKDKSVLRDQVTLAKQLKYFIKDGDTCDNFRKIKEHVIDTMKKLDDNINLHTVDTFIKRLKNSISKCNSTYYSSLCENLEKQKVISDDNILNEQEREKQWLSLLPDTTEYSESVKTVGGDGTLKDERRITDNRFNDTGTSYNSFVKGTFSSSSMNADKIKTKPAYSGIKINSSRNASSSPVIKDNKYEKSSRQNKSNTSFAQTTTSVSSKPQKTVRTEQQDRLPEHSPKNKKLATNNYKPVNETQHTQTNAQHQFQPHRPKTIPDPQTSRYPSTPNQQSQQSKPKTTSRADSSKHPETHQNSFKLIKENRLTTNKRDTEFGKIHIPSSQPQQTFTPQTIRDIQKPATFGPSVSTPSQTQKPLSNVKVISQSYKRPTIIMLSPTGSSIHDETDEQSQTKSNSIEQLLEGKLVDKCECLHKKKRPDVCAAHMTRLCRICNVIKPYYYPSFRYPSFYYHKY